MKLFFCLGVTAMLVVSSSAYAFIIPPPPGGCPPTALCAAPRQLITVPAYFGLNQHTDLTEDYDWNRIKAQGGKIQTVVALGAAGGFQTCDNTGMTCSLSATQAQFAANSASYQNVYGYIDSRDQSNWALRSFGSASDSMRRELDQWRSKFDSSQVQGMFIDDGPSFDVSQNPLGYVDSNFSSYYTQLYTLLRSTAPRNYRWSGAMLNASQFPNPWVLSAPAADSAIVFENNAATYFGQYYAIGPGGALQSAPGWWQSPGMGTYTTAHVVFNANQYDLTSVIDSSKNRGASLVYVHDRHGRTVQNTDYGGLACYFEQEVAYAVNGQPPSGMTTWCAASAAAPTAACYDLTSDRNQCGACGTACGGSLACINSSCQFDCSSCSCGCNTARNACFVGSCRSPCAWDPSACRCLNPNL